MGRAYLLSSDFDQTLSFNDSGIALSELGLQIQEWDEVRTDFLTIRDAGVAAGA